MESIVKVDFGEVFRKIFGFDKEENDMKKIEEEADMIRKVSDGISWDEYLSEKSKSEKTNNLYKKVPTRESKTISKGTIIKKDKDIDISR